MIPIYPYSIYLRGTLTKFKFLNSNPEKESWAAVRHGAASLDGFRVYGFMGLWFMGLWV